MTGPAITNVQPLEYRDDPRGWPDSRGRPDKTTPSPPAVVGRNSEFAMLRERLAAALAGHGSLTLIGGEAGIGKTALAEALSREASAQGALVLVGRSFDLAETAPYGPWLDLFAHYHPAEV